MRPGERFAMPDGSTYVLLTPGADTDGAFVEMEFVLPARCVPPPPHVHRSQVEEYEVIEGALEVVVDDRWQTLGPGDRAAVPVGAAHTFRNRSGGVVRVRNWHRPALRFDAFIAETSTALSRAGVRRPRDPRIPLILSRVMLQYDESLAPSRRREQIAMGLLARIARALNL